ncbi:MAG: amidohydrolase family protein, partial [Lachnospiraceae bacterium]|nr:amidohydrolase family protein [Lachnospiraceae bacterium]
CHFGNPWLMDAAAVVEKNENVATDLSGLLVGKVNFSALLKKQRLYLDTLKTWISYCDCYDKFMFGTDWPLANYEDYIEFIQWLIPEYAWDQVFHQTAERIYQL